MLHTGHMLLTEPFVAGGLSMRAGLKMSLKLEIVSFTGDPNLHEMNLVLPMFDVYMQL